MCKRKIFREKILPWLLVGNSSAYIFLYKQIWLLSNTIVYIIQCLVMMLIAINHVYYVTILLLIINCLSNQFHHDSWHSLVCFYNSIIFTVLHTTNASVWAVMITSISDLFGVRQHGVHINGFTRSPTEGLLVWVGMRAASKATFPSKFDQMVSGACLVEKS